MDANFVSRYHNRIKADPGVALMSNIKAPFGKWDALFSRYEYQLEHSYLKSLSLRSLNEPPTYHVKAGCKGHIRIALDFEGLCLHAVDISLHRSYVSF